MRSRRSDYVALSSQANDMPYHPLETHTETRADDKPPQEKAPSSAYPPGSYILDSNLRLERSPSSNSRVSSIEKGLDLDRNHPLVSESIFGTQYWKARSSHFEWNSWVAADRFSLSIAGPRTLAGSGLGIADRIPVFAAGEHTKSQFFDHSFWFKDASLPASCSLLQRQSSGGSFTDSLLSGDVPLSSISPTVSISASDSAFFGSHSEGGKGVKQTSTNSQQSWAQQTEQSYNLQLTLALRLVAEAEITEEPILLPSSNSEVQPFFLSAGSSSVQATSLRFWVNGSLGYADRIRDGFYHIWGMNPYIWKLCSHTDEAGGRLPTLELLRAVNPTDSLMEVIMIDKHGDAHLCDLENQAFNFALTAANSRELAELLGKLVSDSMGGEAADEPEELMPRWKASSKAIKECLNCVVFPIGSVSVGVCRHRALLFKALADSVNLPCRIARGCKYCGHDDGASCLVLCGNQREFLVDLIASPGMLCCPENFLKSRPAPNIVSPLRLPELKASEISGSDGLEWKSSINSTKSFYPVQSDQREGNYTLWERSSNDNTASRRICAQNDKLGGAASVATSVASKAASGACAHQASLSNDDTKSVQMQIAEKLKEAVSIKHHTSDEKCIVHNPESSVEANSNMIKQTARESGSKHFSYAEVDMDEVRVDAPEQSEGIMSKAKSLELSLASDGWEIGWEELSVKERIGAGSFGTVHRADWNGSDVAVKVFIEQDFLEERLDEFMREVAIMKRTRHPNVVLFMGVVTKRPNFSIVTEYLPRGSLFRLLHRPGMRELLDERRRVRMALDVARGLNYLHRLNPPIVHRDLKSPNLLVDKTWTVKVCDFGLSRLKMKTFLSSRSAAGTAEWMAPEVLRDEPSNEKSDVYSFGVILWELFTLQQPWSGLSPAQVVGAVGFQHRRLLIPKDLNPEIAALIESCWANDPRQRPSFTNIMESLKPLLRPVVAAQVEATTS